MLSVFDLIFPRQCVGCGKWGRYICINCQSQLQTLLSGVCPGCYFPLNNTTHIRCLKRTNLDGTVSVYDYNSIMKKIIKSFKYKLYSQIRHELFQTIDQLGLSHFAKMLAGMENVYLLPIPLHPARERLRGFNQSLYISNYFSKRFSIPIIDGIERIKNTRPQASLSGKEERKNNIQNAFAVTKNHFDGKSIILVDDVFTTGSTLNEVAKLIKKHHANRVFAFTLAHGSFRKQ